MTEYLCYIHHKAVFLPAFNICDFLLVIEKPEHLLRADYVNMMRATPISKIS